MEKFGYQVSTSSGWRFLMEYVFIVILCVLTALWAEYRYVCGMKDSEKIVEETTMKYMEQHKKIYRIEGAKNTIKHLEDQGLLLFMEDGTLIGKDDKVFNMNFNKDIV